MRYAAQQSIAKESVDSPVAADYNTDRCVAKTISIMDYNYTNSI